MSLLLTASDGEQNGNELAAAVGLTESTVSHHLSQLRKAGLVESDRRGMNVYHRARRDALQRCASCPRTAAPATHSRGERSGAKRRSASRCSPPGSDLIPRG